MPVPADRRLGSDQPRSRCWSRLIKLSPADRPIASPKSRRLIASACVEFRSSNAIQSPQPYVDVLQAGRIDRARSDRCRRTVGRSCRLRQAERIVRHELPRARIIIPSPHVDQPVPIARNPILPHKRKRIRNPRADRRDLAEGIVAVLVDVHSRRIRDPDRRALEVVVVVIRRSARG